jgi:DNA-binding MarR family transcriptional regulator
MKGRWGFLTNHALVLIYVICHPASTVRQIAAGIGVTERATLAILRELDEEGIIQRHRDGRRNTYTVNFAALASYRREGAADRTPQGFVETMVRTLVQLHPATESGSELPANAAIPTRTGTWGFFTNHLIILLCVAREPSATVREIAVRVEMTERAVLAILSEMDEDGIIRRTREGRRNSYEIDLDAFRSFPRWSTGSWQLPPELVATAVTGMRTLVKDGGGERASGDTSLPRGSPVAV